MIKKTLIGLGLIISIGLSLAAFLNSKANGYSTKLNLLNYELDVQGYQAEVNYRFRVNGSFPDYEVLLKSHSNTIVQSNNMNDPFLKDAFYFYSLIIEDGIGVGYRIISAGIDGKPDRARLAFSA